MNIAAVSSLPPVSFRKFPAVVVAGLLLVLMTAATAWAWTSTPSYKFTHLAGPLGRGITDETFAYPIGVAVDHTGIVYVADQLNHTIRKVTPNGVVTVLAGTTGVAGFKDGTSSEALFNSPTGVTVDHEGNLYVADLGNHIIRKITAAGFVSTFAGEAGLAGSSDGTGQFARFYIPTSLAVDQTGNVYVADLGNDTIRKITPERVVTTLAGTAGNSGYSNGTGKAARFISPKGLAVDQAGNVYVADLGNDVIRKITPAGLVTTLAGAAGEAGLADGVGSGARFNGPIGVAADRKGNVYVTDSFSTIRKITAEGVVTTEAGNAAETSVGVHFIYPSGLAVDESENLYVADNGGDAIHLGVPANQYAALVDSAVK